MSVRGSVVLISPPLRGLDEADLGMATLLAALRSLDFDPTAVYGTQLFPRSWTNSIVSWHYATYFFVPHLRPEVTPEECADALLERYLQDTNLQGVRMDPGLATFAALGLDEAQLRREILADIALAGVGMQRTLDAALAGEQRVFGVSCTFENQLPAGLALIDRIRAARPDAWIVLGGAACQGSIGQALVAARPTLDAVCHAEGDTIIGPLMSALCATPAPASPAGKRDPARAALRDSLFARIGGLVWVGAGGEVERSPAPPLIRDLDAVPVPDYDDFVEQLGRGAGAALPPKLYFESSRGCWWGQKHLCSFCGLNATGLVYRRKSPDRVVAEIEALHRRYPAASRLYAADNIIEMDYLRSVMPRLAERRREGQTIQLFYEIKSNLRADQCRTLADAGVDKAQPGIEAFSDEILERMDKGVTGLGQIQHLRYLAEAGIEAVYNILLKNPGDQAVDYRRMTALLPYIEHLRPPQLGLMELSRFSPYFEQPERFGVRDIRPRSYYRFVFGDLVALDDLAYFFDYDHDSFADSELSDALREFTRQLIAWNEQWLPDLLHTLVDRGQLYVVDRRHPERRVYPVAGAARRVFDHVDRARPHAAVLRAFTELAPEALAAARDTWLHRRWVAGDHRGRYVGVVPRRDRTPVSAGSHQTTAARGSGPAAWSPP